MTHLFLIWVSHLTQESRELDIRQRNLIYATPLGATVLQPPGMQVPMGMYPQAGIAMSTFSVGQPTGPAPIHQATVTPPTAMGYAQGIPVGGVAQGQPFAGAGGSSSAGGSAETIEQFASRLGMPPSVAGQLREIGVNTAADLAGVDERRLDSAGLKPAFKAVILRNVPRNG